MFTILSAWGSGYSHSRIGLYRGLLHQHGRTIVVPTRGTGSDFVMNGHTAFDQFDDGDDLFQGHRGPGRDAFQTHRAIEDQGGDQGDALDHGRAASTAPSRRESGMASVKGTP